jgi:hypothetical protein
VHGGKTPGGIASPHFKTGRRSKYLKHLPAALKGGYKAALADPELLSLKDDLGLLTTRIMGLLDNLSAVQAPPWGRAVEAFNDVLTARDSTAKEAALAALGQLLRTGADAARLQETTWCGLQDAIALKAKTAAAEWKRLHDLGALAPIDEIVAFFGYLLDVIWEVVPDRDARQTIQAEVLRYLGHGGPKVVEAEPG